MSVTSCIWRSSHKILGVISHPCFWLFLKLSFHVIFLIFSEFSQAGVRDDQRHMETPTSSPGSSRFPIWRLLSLNSYGHHIGKAGAVAMEMNSMGWFQRIVRAVSIVQIRQNTRWGPFHKIHIPVDKGHWNFTNPQECSFFHQSLGKIHWWIFIPSENLPYESNSFVKEKFCFSPGTLRKSGPQSNNLQKFCFSVTLPRKSGLQSYNLQK